MLFFSQRVVTPPPHRSAGLLQAQGPSKSAPSVPPILMGFQKGINKNRAGWAQIEAHPHRRKRPSAMSAPVLQWGGLGQRNIPLHIGLLSAGIILMETWLSPRGVSPMNAPYTRKLTSPSHTAWAEIWPFLGPFSTNCEMPNISKMKQSHTKCVET